MLPVVSTRHLRWIEYAYAALMMFALTQGPVYQLWSASSDSLVISAKTSMMHVYFATFVVVQLPAIVIVARTCSIDVYRHRPIQLLAALHVWLGCTVLWSTLARQSLPEFIALVLTSTAGVYLAMRFRSAEIWGILAVAMATGLVLSLVAVNQKWDLAIDATENYWIGIYYNRNSLAPVAGVALIASLGLLVVSLEHRGARRNVRTLGAVSLAVLSCITLWRSESRTTPFALVTALAALILWQLLHRVPGRPMQRFGSARLSVVIVAIGVFLALRNVASLTGVPAETSTFNSRAALWSQNWTGFLERPLQGWGWMAARHTAEFFKQGTWWAAFPTEWSHNGYHDLLLGGGVLAIVLFVSFLLSSFGYLSDSPRDLNGMIRFVAACFVLVAATQESFFIGSHFLWVILIWGLISTGLKPALVDQEDPGNDSV